MIANSRLTSINRPTPPAVVFLIGAFLLSLGWAPSTAGAETFATATPIKPLPGANDTRREIGAAKTEITPLRPILLSGYAARTHQLQLNVRHRLWAHALAVSEENGEPAILLTVDNVGVPASVRAAVTKELAAKHSVSAERITITSTHTHGGPMLPGVLENLLTRKMTPVERAAVDDYGQFLTERLIELASQALESCRVGYLYWGSGEVGFAINRRNETVTDHDMPMLVAVDPEGHPFAIIANYACHCVSASNGMLITSDWAGCAVAEMERQLPNVVSMVTIGCGGDQNPADKGGVEASERQGRLLADEVLRVLQTELQPINGPLTIAFQEIALPFAQPPTETEWKERAQQNGINGYHASRQLQSLQQGTPLPESLAYPIQTWRFGNDLSMVFLGGEVVIDYALLLKSDFGKRTWVTAYANDVACYIPSERVLRLGGYEGNTSMLWYNQPNRFVPGLEKAILGEVTRQLKDKPKSVTENARPSDVSSRLPQEPIETR